MSRRAVALIVGFTTATLLPAWSQAIIIGPTLDPHDNPDVVSQVAHDPRVEELRREANAFRKRIMSWKERDFLALFGKPVSPGTVNDALMTVEARTLGLSGMASSDPKANKNHTEAYPVADVGHLVVYFGHDGEHPVYALSYLKTDKDFLKLDRAGNLEKRLAWEKPRFARLIKEVARRWRQVVVWEIDPEKEKAQSQGLESGDFAIKIRAAERWGKERGYTLKYEPPVGDEEPSWAWFQGEVLMARAYHDRGFKGSEATPSHFEFYRPDGSLLRDEMGWPSLELVRWYRPGGEQRMACVEAGAIHENGAWRPYAWSWYDKRGKVVRKEEDSNGDGIPDVQGKSDLFNQKPQTPLSIDRSWAVNPTLIPEDHRNPGQPDPRVPLRRIPE
jgi:hypothetical protein